MKKIILILSFMTGMSVMAQAQIIRKSPEQRAAHTTKVLQRTLNLTADQALQVQSAYLTQATRMDSLKSNLSADKRTNNLTRKSIMLSTERQVMSVLNNDQQTRFIQWEKMQKEKHRATQATQAPVTPPVQG